jgi:hypothetical protein
MSNQNLLTIVLTNYPSSILLGTKTYELNFQITNNSNKPEQVIFHFTMEGIEGKISKNPLEPVVLEPGKPFSLLVPITPIGNGSAKLILQSNIYQEVKYKEKVWHIKDELPPKRGKEALMKSFLNFKDLKKEKKKFPKFKNGKSLSLEDAAREYEKVFSSNMDQIEKDSRLQEISRQVYNKDKNFAFEVLKMVQNEAAIQELLADFIYAALDSDMELALSKLSSLKDSQIKDDLIQNIIPHILEKDLDMAIDLSKQINNLEIRDVIIRDIFYYAYLKKFDEAMQLVNLVTDNHIQLGLYYEIIKILKKSDPSKCDALLQNMIQKSVNTNEIEILVELVIILALIHNPKQAVDIIETFPPNIKAAVKKQILKYFWNEIEEEKVRIEEVPISSLYYGFNVMAKPTPIITKISELGGTVSSNLIEGNMNSVIGIVNLFSFNFPIYPTIEQCYAEIKDEKGKSFYYLIIPLKNAEKSSYETVQTIIRNLFVDHSNQVSHRMYIFNLDFIPYLSKPTIIVEDDPEENIVMQSIIKRVFKKDVSLIIDDGLFKGGKIKTWIKSILPSSKFKLLNIVLTYDFLNNYALFKKFMSEFVH